MPPFGTRVGMKRREVLGVLGSAFAAWPLVAARSRRRSILSVSLPCRTQSHSLRHSARGCGMRAMSRAATFAWKYARLSAAPISVGKGRRTGAP